MQRKTNLFYTTSQDSNFLTFSNYTEALTGNFLATDWKVYPSKFLCLYIPSLTEENKDEFIRDYLVGRYENKLAFLRDQYSKKVVMDIEQNDIEEDIHSLAWLFDTIKKFDSDTYISFIGEVTEFDYKGSYTDTICVINGKDGIDKVHDYDIEVSQDVEMEYSEEYLYGWTKEELASTDYADDPQNNERNLPFFDIDNAYYTESSYSLNEKEEQSNEIKFNVVIPLFDIVNIDYRTNFDTIDETVSLVDENGQLVDILEDGKAIKSVNNPLGIWFGYKTIILERDINTKYAPSWGLTISSQFKPFPYSDDYHHDNITAKDNQQAFQTYAQILAMQDNLSKKVDDIYKQLSKINERLSKLDNLAANETLQEVLDMKDTAVQVKDIVSNIDTIISTEVETQLQKIKLTWNKVNKQ